MMVIKIVVGIAVLSGPHHRNATNLGRILPTILRPLEVSNTLIELVEVKSVKV